MTENQSTNQEFKKSLGLLDATLIVSGSMIGSGIFIVSADMLRLVGSAGWLLFLWVLTGVITIFAALSYGELAGMMPTAGGQFVYIQRAWGRFTAFLYGWSVFTVIQSGVIAAVAVAFAKFSAVFFPFFSVDNILLQIGNFKINAAQILAIVSIFVITYINSRGVQGGKTIQGIFTGAKLVALFALIILGVVLGIKSGNLSQNFTDMWAAKTFAMNPETKAISVTDLAGMGLILALGTAVIGSLFSSDAWNNVTFIAAEIKNPQRNIPLSLLLGTVIVTIIYCAANISYLSLLPLDGIMWAEKDRVGTAAAAMIFGDTAVSIMAVLIMISTFGCNVGLILAGARVYYAMGKDGLFLKKAATLNERQVPAFALWTQAVWASLLCLSGSYGDLLDYCTFVSLIFYIITIAGIFILRKTDPDAERPYRVPLYPILPILYIVLATAICLILLYTKTQNTMLGLLIVGLGIPVYFWQNRKKAL